MVVEVSVAKADNELTARGRLRKKPVSKPSYSLVALDLDGTLLQSNHEMGEVQAEYLRSLHKRGFQICFATGRAAPSIYQHIKKLNLPDPIPVVCSNGGRGFLCDTNLNKQELFYVPVPNDVVKRTVALAKEHGFSVQFYYEDSIHVTNATTNELQAKSEEYSKLTGSEILPSEDEFQSFLQKGQLPCKLLVLFENKDCKLAKKVFQAAFPKSEATIVMGQFGWFLEILHPYVTKGFGLKCLCDALNVPLQNSIAMGDGMNDLEFLRCAGLGVAMRNSRARVRRAANVTIVWTNDQHGVMRTLQALEESKCLRLTKPV